MPMKRFITYSAIGGVLWATGVTMLGYWLGGVEFVGDHIDLLLVLVVLLSVVPIIIEVLRARSTKRDVRYDEDSERADVLREIADDDPQS
jgi:membrane-associated protein